MCVAQHHFERTRRSRSENFIAKHFICTIGATSFCVRKRTMKLWASPTNEVARPKVEQMMLCPADTNEKSENKVLGFLAGMAGFEPTDARVKVWCLTAWRHPNMNFYLFDGLPNYCNTISSFCQDDFLDFRVFLLNAFTFFLLGGTIGLNKVKEVHDDSTGTDKGY